MDDPSPLLKRLPPANNKAETTLLDFLCYYAAMHHKFSGYEVNETIVGVADEIKQGCCPFEDIQAPIKEELAHIVAKGRECYCKLVVPFARTGTKNPEFVVSVANGFETFSGRFLQLWCDAADRAVLYTAQRVIHGEIVRSLSNSNLCAQLCALIMEAVALEYRLSQFVRLNRQQKADASHPVVRQMFWMASFLYSTIDRKWDLARDHGEWLNAVADPDMRPIRKEIYQLTHQCMERVEQKRSCLSRLKEIVKTMDNDSEKAIVRKQIKDLSPMVVTRIHPTPETERAWKEALANSNGLITLFEIQALFDDEEEAPRIVEEPMVLEEPHAALSKEDRELLEGRFGDLDPTRDNFYLRDGTWFADGQLVQTGEENEGENAEELRIRRNEAEQLRIQKEKTKAEQLRKERNEAEQLRIQKEKIEAEQIRVENERKEAEQLRILKEKSEAELLALTEDLAKEVAAESVEEARALRDAQDKVLSNRSSLPMEFFKQLVTSVLPDLEGVLEPTIECFLCCSDLDFSDYHHIRFLTCCVGGTFCCWECYQEHRKRIGHAPSAEREIVRQTALIRKALMN